MKKIKIFLASSIEDLKDDRLQIGDYFRQLNEIYFDSDIHFSLIKCEDYDNALISEGKQSQYDREIRESELVFFLFFRKVGDYTKHEFDVALEAFKEKNKPKIVTYFKYVTNISEVGDEVRAFMQMLDGELHHYYNTYGHIDTLKLGIIMQIKLMKLDASELCIRDGKVLLNGQTVALSENVPMLNGHEALRELTQKKRELQQVLDNCQTECTKSPTPENFKAYSEASVKLDEVSKQLTIVEKQTMEFVSTIAEMTFDGKVYTHRIKAALKCFDAGDYEAAQMILTDRERTNELQRFQNRMSTSKLGLQGYIEEGLLWIRAEQTKMLTAERAAAIISVYEELVELTEEYHLDKGILYDYALFLWSQNRNNEALTIAEILKWYYDKPGTKMSNEKWAYLFNLLGSVYVSMGRIDAAEREYRRAIDLLERPEAESVNERTPDLMTLYQNLGVACFRKEEYDQAEVALHRAHALCNLLYAMDPKKYEPHMANICELLGNTYCKQGAFELAETAYQNSLQICERLCTENPNAWESAWASICYNMSLFYMNLHCYEEAEEELCKAIEVYERLFVRNPDVYKSNWEEAFANLSQLYFRQNRPDKMLPFCQSAIDMFQKLEEREPGTYGDMLYWLGVMLRNLSKYGQ